MSSEEKWFYPLKGYAVHQINPSWYERIEDIEDYVRFKPNTICHEIDDAKISSKKCCSDQNIPHEDSEAYDNVTVYKAARFVRGFEYHYPERWGIEVICLDIWSDIEYAAYLSLTISNNADYFDWHHIYISSEEEKQRLLDWFKAFTGLHGFVSIEDFPVKIEYHKGERKAQWLYEGNPVLVEEPDIRKIRGTTVKTDELGFELSPELQSECLVEVQLNPRFDEYMEFCKKKRLEDSCFSFNEEPILVSLEQDSKWKDRVDAYRQYLRGKYQDDIAHDLGVTQGAVSKWMSNVRGELSRHMGAEYELFLKDKLSLRPDVFSVTHDGAKGKPDLVLKLKDGSFEVISVKCFNTPRSTVTISIEEINPELMEAYRLQSQGYTVKLLVDYYNLDGNVNEVQVISLDKPPKRLNFRR